MSKYTYYTPTKLYIDEDVNKIGEIINSYGFKKVLFLYGKNSIKQSGLYNIIINSLDANNIEYIEAFGVEPNPKIEFVRDVLNKNYEFDFILAVGGGSVIDTAKSISVSYQSGNDPWEYNIHKKVAKKSIPIGVILTISAAGSEMSNSCVISSLETNDKQGFNNDLMRPLFAIMNAELTYGVNKYQTACGIVDILMHTLERFITDDDLMVSSEFAIGIIKTVIKNGLIAYNEPDNYIARKNLMLASSFSHNGLTSMGHTFYFRCHKFEHVISGFYDHVSHGAGLAICWPAYAKYVYKDEAVLPRFLRLAYEVFDVEKTDNKLVDAYRGILRLEAFFKSLGMPTRMQDLNIGIENLERFALKLTNDKKTKVVDYIAIDYNRALEIFKLMWVE